MDAEKAGSGEPDGVSRDVLVREEDAARTQDELEDALLTRLEHIVALAGRRGEPALHNELLDELRSLVRDAESLRPSPSAREEEVVERPARRLHGT